MNVDVVARKEFNDAIRSRLLIVVTLLFFVLTLLATGIYTLVDIPLVVGGDERTVEQMIDRITTGATVFIPLIAIVLSYKAIVGERNSGSLALILSLPNTRRDVFFGKFVGRSSILLIATGGALLAGTLVSAWQLGIGSVATFLTYIVLLTLLGLVYVALGLALSAATNSSIVSAAGSIVALGVFRFLWTPAWLLVYVVGNRVVKGDWKVIENVLQEGLPTWLEFVLFLNPHAAYGLAVDEFVYGEPSISFPIPNARGILGFSDPFFASPWVAILLLVAWIGGLLTVGFLRFDSTDL